MERDAVAGAVERDVQGRRGSRHGIDRAAAGGRRELNRVGKALGVDADRLTLGLERTALEFVCHIILAFLRQRSPPDLVGLVLAFEPTAKLLFLAVIPLH